MLARAILWSPQLQTRKNCSMARTCISHYFWHCCETFQHQAKIIINPIAIANYVWVWNRSSINTTYVNRELWIHGTHARMPIISCFLPCGKDRSLKVVTGLYCVLISVLTVCIKLWFKLNCYMEDLGSEPYNVKVSMRVVSHNFCQNWTNLVNVMSVDNVFNSMSPCGILLTFKNCYHLQNNW